MIPHTHLCGGACAPTPALLPPAQLLLPPLGVLPGPSEGSTRREDLGRDGDDGEDETEKDSISDDSSGEAGECEAGRPGLRGEARDPGLHAVASGESEVPHPSVRVLLRGHETGNQELGERGSTAGVEEILREKEEVIGTLRQRIASAEKSQKDLAEAIEAEIRLAKEDLRKEFEMQLQQTREAFKSQLEGTLAARNRSGNEMVNSLVEYMSGLNGRLNRTEAAQLGIVCWQLDNVRAMIKGLCTDRDHLNQTRIQMPESHVNAPDFVWPPPPRPQAVALAAAPRPPQ